MESGVSRAFAAFDDTYWEEDAPFHWYWHLGNHWWGKAGARSSYDVDRSESRKRRQP